MGNRWGNSGNSVRLNFVGAPKSLQMVIAAMKLKDTYSLEGKLGLISFRIDWIDLFAVQRILKSLLQHHSSKASILWRSAFFIVHHDHEDQPCCFMPEITEMQRWKRLATVSLFRKHNGNLNTFSVPLSPFTP